MTSILNEPETKITKHQLQIKNKARVNTSSNKYIERNLLLFGGVKKIIPGNHTIAAKVAKSDAEKPISNIVTVGKAPDGFGKQVLWDENDKSLAVVVFLNAGDSLGVMISGVKPTDSIEIVSATGIASFAEETKNKGVGSFIGIVAAGANITAAAFGAPELAPVIGAAEKFAKEEFQEEKVKTKRRDPFGEDPGTGLKAREEGGVIISLPEAGQIFYSGNGDHKDRWIKEPGVRDDAHRPDHVRGAFFLQAGRGDGRVAGKDGDFIIAPWDWKFEDNFGFYRLNILLKRGDGKPPVVDKKNQKPSQKSTVIRNGKKINVVDHRTH